MKKLIAGNWKMNLNGGEAAALAQDIAEAGMHDDVDVLVCPPFVYLDCVWVTLKDTSVFVGAQDCSAHDDGAYTGQVSSAMLDDIGCEYVIVGHSERRQYNQENDADVRVKAQQVLARSMTPIICVGETLEEREAGRAQDVVGAQIRACVPEGGSGENIVIAYEPVWAIGTGKTASAEDVADMHAFIRDVSKEVLANSDKTRILYGGSMKPANARELLATPNVDGGLIGGASLKAEDFMAIVKAAHL